MQNYVGLSEDTNYTGTVKCEEVSESSGLALVKEVMSAHLKKSQFRTTSLLVVTLLAASLSLAGCGNKTACAPSSGLTTTTGIPGTTLPPSHDNDAGRGRIPDVTPDADEDANQRPPVCSQSK